MVSGCVAWIQFNGSPKFLSPCVQIPVEAIQDEGKRVVGFTERAVQFQSFDRRRLRLGKAYLGVITAYCQSPNKA